MQECEKLFRKAAELVPVLARAEAEKYEKIKTAAFEESAGKSEFVQKFIRALFELTDEKRRRCSMDNIPVKPRSPGKYILTEQDKEKLEAIAVDGVIFFDDYIKTINEILNPK